MIKKTHIKILYFFWLFYLLLFLFIDLKLILSILGFIGTIGTIFVIRKNTNDELKKAKRNLNAISYCSVIVFSIFLIVSITGLKGFNWLYFSTLFVIDHHFFYFINWTPWKKKKEKEKKEKGKIREWIESILFAIFAATLIHIFTIQPYIIPTSSLEGTLLRGDFLFVSKFHYGANVPNTPLFLPFMHNTLPFTENTPSYLDWIQLGYNRLPGFQDIKNNDIVVFHWPTDDTDGTRPNMPFDKKLNYVKRCLAIPGDSLELKDGELYINSKIQTDPNRGKIQHSYWIQYDNKRANQSWEEVKKELHNKYEVELQYIRHNEEKSPYPKDVNIGYYTDLIVSGSEEEIQKIKDADTIIKIAQNIICTGELEVIGVDKWNQYVFKRPCLNDSLYKKNNRIFSELFPTYTLNQYGQKDTITSLFPQNFKYKVTFKEITKNCTDSSGFLPNKTDTKIVEFKYDPNWDNDNYEPIGHNWDNDNYGPIKMPKEGEEIVLNEYTIALYADIITNYENNNLEIIHLSTIDCTNTKEGGSVEEVKEEYIFKINGKETKKYTIQMDQGYYWMMGDNRHNSQDSRCWGFVPFSHVVGKPLLVWLSVDWNADNLFHKVRWSRLFTTVHGDGESRWYFPHFLILLVLFLFRKRIKKLIKPILKKIGNSKNMDQSPD